jgi:hypothetical protein
MSANRGRRFGSLAHHEEASRMFKRHVSYANVAATLALVFAMSGGALAAKHYLINSTKQINPKVLKALKGKTGATGAAGAQGKEGSQGKEGPQGPGTTIVNHVHGAAALESTSTATPYGLVNGTWNQGPTEANQLVADVVATIPPTSKCNVKGTEAGELIVELFLQGKFVAFAVAFTEAAEQKAHATQFVFAALENNFAETGAVVPHTVTAKILDSCGASGGSAERHPLVETVNVDVLGAH